MWIYRMISLSESSVSKAGDRITIKYLDEGGLNPVQELN